MPVTRLNHAVMYVSDVRRSVAFYSDVMGFEPVGMTPPGFNGAAFLRASGSTNDHDLGLFEIGASAGASQAGHGQVGLYHLAWEVDTLGELVRTAERLQAVGGLVGASDHGTTKSLYAQRPRRARVRGGLADPCRPAGGVRSQSADQHPAARPATRGRSFWGRDPWRDRYLDTRLSDRSDASRACG